MLYLETAVARPLPHPLTYRLPAAEGRDLRPGVRLLVPLGREQVTGYLLAVSETPPAADFSVREIIEVIDPEPLFPAAMVPFFRWLAAYYHHPIGEVIETALPGGLNRRSRRSITVHDQGARHIEAHAQGLRKPPAWMARLQSPGRLESATVRSLWRAGSRRALLREWHEKGWITIEETVNRDAVREKTELCYAPADPGDPPHLKPSEQKTLAILGELGAEQGSEWVSRRDLNKRYRGAGAAARTLLAKGLLRARQRRVYRDPFGQRPPCYPEPETLTPEQTTVLAALKPALDRRSFAPFLLHGVTGSGKTEVYLQATAHCLASGRNVLLLVPEIALATQLEGNFLARFGDAVALLHSGLSQGERLDQWLRVCRGQARVVIGARSAVFAPLTDIGLIIVDEEHEGSYKQDNGFLYQGRDAAVLRGRQQEAVVILGSATPSVVSRRHAETGKYTLLTMKSRVADRPLPEVTVIDLKKVPTVSGRPPLFSPQLVAAVRQTLEAGNQSLIFLNRRGYANMMVCRDCGSAVQCRHCNISLTLHQHNGRLVCHYCGFALPAKTVCATCRSTDLMAVGSGTEKVEEELVRHFPRARIARLDRDISANRAAYMKILHAVRNREIDILVGTQMITKGHHFPHVTLVGVVWADAGLGMPDYKAGERTFQILTQVFGRAGRGEKEGRVVVQTHFPEHYSILTARGHDYDRLYEEEITLRRRLAYPPFSRLVNLRFEGKEEERVRAAARETADRLRVRAGKEKVAVLGPAPAPLVRLRGLYRWQVLLKGPHAGVQRLCLLLENGVGMPATVKMTVDVDPDSML